MELLFRNITAVTMRDEEPVIKNAYLGITGGRISWLSTEEPQEAADRVIDGTNLVVMPGLVNAHTHLAMTLMRGYADDYALQTWLYDHVFPVEAKLDDRCVAAGFKLGVAECLAHGITSVSDMYMRIPSEGQAALETGIKANISNGATCFDRANYNFDTDSVTLQMREMLDKYHLADNGRIKLDASIHGEYTSFPELWEANAAFAREHALCMHVHMSETQSEHNDCIGRWGMSPAAVLNKHGVFDTRALVAHGVWITEEDMDILREKNVTVAHNPVSNLKLGSGVAPVAKMLHKGVRVALGTDGVCSNNNHDLFEEIKLAAILQKGVSMDPTLLPAWQTLKLATVGGAYAQGREGECGVLAVGMDADLAVLDFDAPNLYPSHSPVSALCYAARGSNVCMTLVRGRVLYERGAFATIDMEQLRHELDSHVMPRLFGHTV